MLKKDAYQRFSRIGVESYSTIQDLSSRRYIALLVPFARILFDNKPAEPQFSQGNRSYSATHGFDEYFGVLRTRLKLLSRRER